MIDKLSKNVQGVEIRTKHLLGISILLVFTMLPSVMGELALITLAAHLFFVGFVVSWDLISGYTGKISFGHSAFLGIGGYTTAILNVHTDIGIVVTVLIGTLAACIFGFSVGLMTLRVEGPYFALVTLIIPLVLLELVSAYGGITGGDIGLTGVERLSNDIVINYYIALGVFALIFGIAFVVVKSNAGLIFKAIREDEVAVSSVGINPNKFKIFAVSLSASLIGFAGAVYVHTMVGSASPTKLLVLTINIELILAGLLGGMGNILGAVTGAFLFMSVRNWLSDLTFTTPVFGIQLGDFYLEIFYIFIVIFVLLFPNGIVPQLEAKFGPTRGSQSPASMAQLIQKYWRKSK